MGGYSKRFLIRTAILASAPVASDSYAPASLSVSVTPFSGLDLKREGTCMKKIDIFQVLPALRQALVLAMGRDA